jgi:hypothetical protein
MVEEHGRLQAALLVLGVTVSIHPSPLALLLLLGTFDASRLTFLCMAAWVAAINSPPSVCL